jgi:pimeloyl-ACP methyl ester carboxylesterase
VAPATLARMVKLSGFVDEQCRSQYVHAYQRTLENAACSLRVQDVPTHFGPTHLIEAGDQGAPPVVLLHGMSFSGTTWVRNLAALAQHHRVVVIDTIGDVNLSRSEQRIRGRDDFVTWLGDVMAGLELERAAFAGNSYGGWLATNLAVKRPELVSHLVLISPAAVFTRFSTAFLRHALSFHRARTAAKAEIFARWFTPRSAFEDATGRAWLEQYCAGVPGFVVCFRFLGRRDLCRTASCARSQRRSFS